MVNITSTFKSIDYIQEIIDLTIKQIWFYQIKEDYHKYYLLKEDTLKNAIYFHLRNQLTDEFLEENGIRIFTEFYYNDYIADIAIVRLIDKPGQVHLKDEVEEVLAIIEVKYKGDGTVSPFNQDVLKIQKYIEYNPDASTQYYLAFIHEVVYGINDGDSWLSARQKKIATGKLTELSGYFQEGKDEMIWQVLSHNKMNIDFSA